jgi:hypothetical protein
MSLALGLSLWCLVGGFFGAIIGRSKNRAPWEAALLGVLLGLIGVLIVATLPRGAVTERGAFTMVWLAALLAGTSYVIATVLLIGPAEKPQEANARVPTVLVTPTPHTSVPPMPVIRDRGATATTNHHPRRDTRLRRTTTVHHPDTVRAAQRPKPTPAQPPVRHHSGPTVAWPGTVAQPVTTEPTAPPPETTPQPATSITHSAIPLPTPPSMGAPGPPTPPVVVASTPPTPPVVVTPPIP